MSQRPVPHEPLVGSCDSLFKLLLDYLEDITVSSSNNQDSSQKNSFKIIISNVKTYSESKLINPDSKIKDFRKKVYTHYTVIYVQGLCNLHLKNHQEFNSSYLYVKTYEIGIQRHYLYEFNAFQLDCKTVDVPTYLLTIGFKYHLVERFLFFFLLFKSPCLMPFKNEIIIWPVPFKITMLSQLYCVFIKVLLLIVIQIPPLAQLCGPYGGDSWNPGRKPVYMEVTVYVSRVGVRSLQSVLTQSIVLIYGSNIWSLYSDIFISSISNYLLVYLLLTVTLFSNYSLYSSYFIVYSLMLQNRLNFQGYTHFLPGSFPSYRSPLISFTVMNVIRYNLSDDCFNDNFRIFRCNLKLSSLLLTFLLKGRHSNFCAIYTTVSRLLFFLEWQEL